MILFSYRTIAMSTHRSAPDNRESKQEQVKKAWNSLSQHLSFLITQETLSVQEAQWIQQLESTFKEPINALSDNRKTRDAYVISTIALLAAVPLFSKKSFGYIVNSIATAANIAKKTPEYFYYGHADYPRYNPEDSLMYQAGITAMLFSPILLILAAVFHFKSYAKAPLLANLAKLKCRADALLSKVPQDTDPSDCFEDGSIKLLFTPEPTLIDAINSDEKSTFEIGTVHRSEKSENYQYVRISDDDRSQKKDLRLLLAELPLSDQTIEDQHPEKVAHTGVAADDKPGIPVSKAKKIKSAKAPQPSAAPRPAHPLESNIRQFLMEGAISNEIRRVHWWKKGSVVIFISIPKVDWDRAYGKDIAIKTDAMKSLNKGAVGKGRGKAGLKYVNGIWELKALGAAGDIRTLIGHGARCRTIAGIRIIDITLHYVKEGTRRLH